MPGTKIGIGFGVFPFGVPSPETICAYAERAEDLGIDSIWLSDRIVSRPSLDDVYLRLTAERLASAA